MQDSAKAKSNDILNSQGLKKKEQILIWGEEFQGGGRDSRKLLKPPTDFELLLTLPPDPDTPGWRKGQLVRTSFNLLSSTCFLGKSIISQTLVMLSTQNQTHHLLPKSMSPVAFYL